MRFALLSAFDTRPPQAVSDPEKASALPQRRRWWLCWELYPIMLLAAFLRFYLIQTTEFDDDQANIFRLAHDAVSQIHLVATSNIASVKIYNPPGIIYLLMLPASFSANPLGGALLIAFLSTLGVLLTYCFTLRYYGRLPATVSALLYATSAMVIFYSRFMWQQNLLLFFAPLFIFVLFRGAVERKRGWFGPALFLLGLIIQLHGSGLLFAVPLAVAFLIAPRTVRWRDVALGIVLLCIIYAPYLLWLVATGFSDVHVLLHNTSSVNAFDTQALGFYQSFLNPLNDLEFSPVSLLARFSRLFRVVSVLTTLLVIAGIALALWQLLGLRAGEPVARGATLWTRLKHWWHAFTASPYRCGLAILLTWQLPVLTLLHHTIKLHPHYLILFMPGPYILAALLVNALFNWCRRHIERGIHISLGGRIVVAGAALLIVGAQTLGALGFLRDMSTGRFIDSAMSGIYYNDLRSLQDALTEADQIAQQRHLHHVYINADDATISAFRYLTYQMRTPVTVTNASCTILPDPASGPVVMLMGPYGDLPEHVAARFATLSPVATSPRLGGPPFQLYIAQASQPPQPARATLGTDLQFVGSQIVPVPGLAPGQPVGDAALLTYWQAQRSLPAANNTLYSYNEIPSSGSPADDPCTFTALAKGDRLMMRLPLATAQAAPRGVQIQAFTTTSYTISFLSLKFDTYKSLESTPRTLANPGGQAFFPLSS